MITLADPDHGFECMNCSPADVPAFAAFLADPDPAHCEECWDVQDGEAKPCTTACRAHLVQAALDGAPAIGSVCTGVTICGDDMLLAFDTDPDTSEVTAALATVVWI